MKLYDILLVILCSLCSCNTEDSKYEIAMSDGNVITVDGRKFYYHTEDEFVHNVSFSFPKYYNYGNVEQIDYLENIEYAISGFDQSFIGTWEVAEFGNWIKAYGLMPNTPYYVATKVYTKYLSETPNGLRIVPKLGGEFMGYCPNITPKTFRVQQGESSRINILSTGVRHIGYDSNRASVNIDIPSFVDNNKDKPIWTFLIRDDGWD